MNKRQEKKVYKGMMQAIVDGKSLNRQQAKAFRDTMQVLVRGLKTKNE